MRQKLRGDRIRNNELEVCFAVQEVSLTHWVPQEVLLQDLRFNS